MSEGPVVAVLSGGGAKAAAHLGALRALAEAGLRLDHIIATSMGAVMGTLVAAGLTPEEALERAVQVRGEDIGSIDPIGLLKGVWSRSLLRPERLRHTLRKVVPVRRFDELKLPLTVTATDLDSGARALFGAAGRDAPLLEVLYASCALPVFFPPGIIAGRRYADGGLRGPLPLEVSLGLQPGLVFAVDAGPGLDEAIPDTRPRYPALVESHDGAIHILMAEATAGALALWRAIAARPPLVYVRPRVERGGTFHVDRLRDYAAEGHRAAARALAERPESVQIRSES